jgi:hypothetical protein
MNDADAATWAELADKDRAESPDGKTGFDRLMDRQARLMLTVQHDGHVRIKTCDNCTDDLTAVITLLEQVTDDLRNGRGL